MKKDGFQNKIENNIKELRLIEPGDKLLIALSGGPDSTALLHILHELSSKLKFSLSACYINHRIRPKAVQKEIEFCDKICTKLNIEFVLHEIDIPEYAKKNKLSLEEAGFIQRKKILQKIANKNSCNKIVLGHHQDDIIETILFRLLRGTGPGGLQPIKPISGNIIRPLYNITKDEILKYLKSNKIRYLIDRSNLKSEFSRNYIRNKIIPVIKKRFGDSYRSAIGNFAEIISAEDDYLAAIASKNLKKIAGISPGGKIVVDLPKIRLYDSWLRRRVIKKILEKLSGLPGTGSFDDIARLDRLIDGELRAVSLEGGIDVVRRGDKIYFIKDRCNIRNVNMNTEGTTELAMLNSRLKCSQLAVAKAIRKVQKGGDRVHIDYDKIDPPCQIRNIKPGDRFTPLGMKGTKKVGDFLTDKKVPRQLRDEIPVIFDNKGLIWLVGFQIADRVKIDKSTKKVLDIEYLKRKINW
jgi:tRNA(Ile)-lysidine synthase